MNSHNLQCPHSMGRRLSVTKGTTLVAGSYYGLQRIDAPSQESNLGLDLRRVVCASATPRGR